MKGKEISNQREAGERAAKFIARELHGNSSALTPLESEGMWLAKGASGIWNSLFRDPEARSKAPDDWAALEAFAARVWRSRTQFPVLLWHGFGQRADHVLSAKAGETLPTPGGFLHTSMSSVVALQNSNMPRVLGQIALPADSWAIFLPGNRPEQEIVLPRVSCFEFAAGMRGKYCLDQQKTKCIVIALDVCYPDRNGQD